MSALSWDLVDRLLREQEAEVRAEVEFECALRYGAVVTKRNFAIYEEMGRRLDSRRTRLVVPQ